MVARWNGPVLAAVLALAFLSPVAGPKSAEAAPRPTTAPCGIWMDSHLPVTKYGPTSTVTATPTWRCFRIGRSGSCTARLMVSTCRNRVDCRYVGRWAGAGGGGKLGRHGCGGRFSAQPWRHQTYPGTISPEEWSDLSQVRS